MWKPMMPKGQRLELYISIYLLGSLTVVILGSLFQVEWLRAVGAILLFPAILAVAAILLLIPFQLIARARSLKL